MREDDIALTIRPVMSCNMRCKHCFNGNGLNFSQRLSIESACSFLKLAAEDFTRIKVTIHGGEPTLMGSGFYARFFECEDELTRTRGVTFNNIFTTNGYELTSGLADLLMKHDTLITVSYDGPYNHVLREHGGEVYRNIMMLKERNARLRIFCTICEHTYTHLKEIYDWFNGKELDFKILPIEPRGFARENSELIMKPGEFVPELMKLYRYWLTDRASRIKFYTFQEFANLRRNMQFKDYWFNYHIALNSDGKIYPFGRTNDVKFCLGRPEDYGHITDCWKHPEYTRLISMIDVYRKERADFCRTCRSWHICRGTSICSSYVYNDEYGHLRYTCDLSDEIFRSVLEVNDEVIRDFEAGNAESYNGYVQKVFAV